MPPFVPPLPPQSFAYGEVEDHALVLQSPDELLAELEPVLDKVANDTDLVAMLRQFGDDVNQRKITAPRGRGKRARGKGGGKRKGKGKRGKGKQATEQEA